HLPDAGDLVDRGDEQRLHRRADDFGRELRRVWRFRELAGRRQRRRELAVSNLVGPRRRVPVGPLIPDEEQPVDDGNQNDTGKGPIGTLACHPINSLYRPSMSSTSRSMPYLATTEARPRSPIARRRAGSASRAVTA